jgi:hypothetical protein
MLLPLSRICSGSRQVVQYGVQGDIVPGVQALAKQCSTMFRKISFLVSQLSSTKKISVNVDTSEV